MCSDQGGLVRVLRQRVVSREGVNRGRAGRVAEHEHVRRGGHQAQLVVVHVAEHVQREVVLLRVARQIQLLPEDGEPLRVHLRGGRREHRFVLVVGHHDRKREGAECVNLVGFHLLHARAAPQVQHVLGFRAMAGPPRALVYVEVRGRDHHPARLPLLLSEKARS